MRSRNARLRDGGFCEQQEIVSQLLGESGMQIGIIESTEEITGVTFKTGVRGGDGRVHQRFRKTIQRHVDAL